MIPHDFLDSAYRKLTSEEFKKFQILYKIFVQKNEQINLSAIRDEQGVWEKHFYDSLLGAEFLEKVGEKVLDLGSGGGFPALPLAIMFPEKQFYPLDSVGKKMRAIQEIADGFVGANPNSRQNIFPLTGRAEIFGRDQKYREQFDVVTVRAFSNCSVSLELALPFLRLQGIALLYRGPEQEKDNELLIKAFGGSLQKKKQCALPSGDKREIWEIRKISPTERRFPRKDGIPKKKPMVLGDFNSISKGFSIRN